MPGEMYDVYMHYKRDEWERSSPPSPTGSGTKYLDVLP